MTTEHITQEQIEAIYTRYGGDMANCAHSIAQQAVANYIEQRAKELPVLPGPEYRLSPDSEPSLYDPYDMQAYGAACAAHAREMALSDSELLDFVEAHPHLTLRNHKKRWSFVGLTNYEYTTFDTARAAIKATLEASEY